jgi:hypothetical protein
LFYKRDESEDEGVAFAALLVSKAAFLASVACLLTAVARFGSSVDWSPKQPSAKKPGEPEAEIARNANHIAAVRGRRLRRQSTVSPQSPAEGGERKGRSKLAGNAVLVDV